MALGWIGYLCGVKCTVLKSDEKEKTWSGAKKSCPPDLHRTSPCPHLHCLPILNGDHFEHFLIIRMLTVRMIIRWIIWSFGKVKMDNMISSKKLGIVIAMTEKIGLCMLGVLDISIRNININIYIYWHFVKISILLWSFLKIDIYLHSWKCLYWYGKYRYWYKGVLRNIVSI